LHQVVLHAFFDHVSSSQVPPHTSLDNDNVALDHQEHVSVDLHPEVGLDRAGGQVEVVDVPAHFETTQPLLDLLGADVQPQVLLFGDGCFHHVQALGVGRPRQETSEGSLDLPGRLAIDALTSLVKRLRDDSLREHVGNEVLSELVDVSSDVSTVDEGFTGFD